MASTSVVCEVGQNGLESPYVTVFVCGNCARPSMLPEAANRSRPSIPDFEWPFPAQQVLLSCAGRLQPEHVLKAFEAGARLVGVVACSEDNCHHLEGSKRCARRVDYLHDLLDEIGLGADRLVLCHLPGTASEDLVLAAGRPAPAYDPEAGAAAVSAVRATLVSALETLTPTPLDLPVSEAGTDPYQQVDTSEDDNDE